MPETQEITSQQIETVDMMSLNKKDIVEKSLNPHAEIDQAGFKRIIYEYNGVSFSFRGKEELPEYPTLKNSKVVILGSSPTHIGQNDYQKYLDTIKSSEETSDIAKKHFLVTKDVRGVVNLALELGAKDFNLNLMLSGIKVGNYSVRTLDLIDKLVAANCISDDKEKWKESLNGGNAEAVVTLALLGKSEANDYLNQQLQKMNKLDSEREVREKSGEKNMFAEHRSLEANMGRMGNLVCVHTTAFHPIETKDGYEVKPLADATNWEYVRNTVHVTINHKVISHWMGNWDQKAYVVLAPMKEMVEQNGAPRCIDEQDTWWTRNPGETLKFSKGVLIEPGEVPDRNLFNFKDRHTIFKDKGYTTNDLLEIDRIAGAYGVNPLNSFSKTLFYNEELKTFVSNNWNVENLSQSLVEKFMDAEDLVKKDKTNYSDILQYHLNGPEEIEFFQFFSISADGNIKIEDRIINLLQEVNIKNAYIGKSDNYDQVFNTLVAEITKDISHKIFSSLSNQAVKETIKRMGFKPFEAGTWPSAHNDSVDSKFVQEHYSHIHEASEISGEDKEGKIILANFDWKKYDPKWVTISEVDSKTRRVMYASGAFNSREE